MSEKKVVTTQNTIQRSKNGFVRNTVQVIKTSPRIRYGLIAYLGSSLVCSFIFNYQSGKESLDDFRKKYSKYSKDDEYKAVKKGMYYDMFSNTLKSLTWPYHIAIDAMALLISHSHSSSFGN